MRGGKRDSFKPFTIDREGQCCKHPAPVQQTPTTLFSDCAITPTEKYLKIVNPERRKLLLVLIIMLIVCPLVFRYACGSSNNRAVSNLDITWAGTLDPWEWVILLVIWVGVVGFIFRLLPMVTGGPSAVESSRVCKLDGVAALGLCSPFSSEDDTILLRSLIGRTCTVLHTTGGRHSIQGFYMDAILNERRIKGEANRRHLWLAWMKFLHALVDVSLLIKEEATEDAAQGAGKSAPSPEPAPEPPAEEDPYRPLYVQGSAGTLGVAAPTQHERNRPVSFRDVGLLLDTTRGMSEARRQQVMSWSRDPARPLSVSMAAAQTGIGGMAMESHKDPSARPMVGNLAKITEHDDDDEGEEEKEFDMDIAEPSLSHISGIRGRPPASDGDDEVFMMNNPYRASVVPSALETAEVDDDDIDMAAFRCADDVDLIHGDNGSPEAMGSASDKSNGSKKRLTTAINAPRAAASGADNRASSRIVIDMRIPGLTGAASPFTPTHGHGPTVAADFPITPNKKPRPMSNREAVISSAYLRPHGISNLDLHMSDLVPMIHLLDAWLNEIKNNEWTYNYHNQRAALEKVFFACPFMTHFKGTHMLAVHAALDALYTAFTTPLKDEPDPKRPFHPDEISEVEWVLHRDNLPDWTVVWCYASRARLREMKRSDIKDPIGPDPVYQSTRIKRGAIVYRAPPGDVIAEYAPLVYFRTRQMLFKVKYVETGLFRPAHAHLIPFYPTTKAGPGQGGKDLESGKQPRKQASYAAHNKELIVPLSELVLLEKNRGKTGALNFFNEYLRAKTFRWRRSLGMRHPIQTFTGIVDARHTLVETDVFWNDALPHFAMLETSGGAPGRRVGSLTEHSICINVQYPQYFTNVGDDDVLDNSNSAYYTLWQTLRDGAKCICSSGSNAIWDISHPSFEFCTTSRSEDLGTSHEYIPHCESVYLCSYVAFGVAKKTEDFLEALYRWSAGPLELLWPGLFQLKILKHHIRTAIPTAVFALASFNENSGWYYLYLIMLCLFCVRAYVDMWMGRRPLRYFIVSTVISTNLFIVISNFLSVTWYIIFPLRMSLYGVLPLGRTPEQGLFWAWVSLFITLPTGLVHDALIRMTKYTAPNTKEMNFHKCLWRGAQLYANSFMYTTLATVAGTYSALKAWLLDYDLSMWSSFRINDSEFDQLTKSVADVSVCSGAYLVFLYRYTMLYLNSCLAALTMPTTMTKWYVTFVFTLQFACLGVSTFIVNRDNLIVLVLVALMCGMNILMTFEAVLLLQPAIKIPLGYPVRMEYIFAILGSIILVSALANGLLSIDMILARVRLYWQGPQEGNNPS